MPSVPETWLQADLAVPNVGAVMSTRAGGVSVAPYDSLNLGSAVGDDPVAVAENRHRFAQALGGATPVFLRQVHGVRVLQLRAEHAAPGAPVEEADACITTEPQLACTIQVADCLPVLFSVDDGRAVGAAHAGWRGLAGGVLEATVAALCQTSGCGPAQIRAWLGACIGPDAFETGEDVLDAFAAQPIAQVADPRRHFRPGPYPGKWLADLPALARDRLAASGLRQISGGAWCTVHDVSRFFSYRRDRVTGRMAAAIWRRG